MYSIVSSIPLSLRVSRWTKTNSANILDSDLIRLRVIRVTFSPVMFPILFPSNVLIRLNLELGAIIKQEGRIPAGPTQSGLHVVRSPSNPLWTPFQTPYRSEPTFAAASNFFEMIQRSDMRTHTAEEQSREDQFSNFMQFPPTPHSHEPRMQSSIPPWRSITPPPRDFRTAMSSSRASFQPSSVANDSIDPTVIQGAVSDQESGSLHASQRAEERASASSRVDDQDEGITPEKPSAPPAPAHPDMAESVSPLPDPVSPSPDPVSPLPDTVSPSPDPVSPSPVSPSPDPISPLSPSPGPISPRSPSPGPISPPADPTAKDTDRAHSRLRIRLPPLKLKRPRTRSSKTSAESEDSAQDSQPGSGVKRRKAKKKKIVASTSLNSDTDVDMNDQEAEVGTAGSGELVKAKQRNSAMSPVHRVIKAPQVKRTAALSDKPGSDQQQSCSKGGVQPMDVDDVQQVWFCLM